MRVVAQGLAGAIGMHGMVGGHGIPYRNGFDRNGLAGLLLVALFGHIFAFPALFLAYFPWSMWAWKKHHRQLWLFLLVGTSLGAVNGLLGGVATFAVAAFATALFHWSILSAVEKRNPHWLS